MRSATERCALRRAPNRAPRCQRAPRDTTQPRLPGPGPPGSGPPPDCAYLALVYAVSHHMVTVLTVLTWPRYINNQYNRAVD